MTIREAIRSAGSERAICLLLTDYLAATGLDKRLTNAEMRGVREVWSSFDELVAELESTAGLVTIPQIAEAVGVFDGAIDRLSQLPDKGFDCGEAGFSLTCRPVSFEPQFA
jgi:hypothetical protein